MKRTTMINAIVRLTAPLVLMAVTGVASAQANLVKVDGSSTVYPVTEAVAEEFQKSKKNAIRATVGVSGTGGGFKKFCRSEIDIANASRPILKQEMAECAKLGIRYYELPVAFDALTIVINPKNAFLKQITIDELKKLWEPGAQGKVMRWNQVNAAWPDQPIKLFGPGADSGTFDYFTEAVVGKAKASRGDFTASEDDNVLVQGVAQDTGALGYFGFAYYAENQSRLKAVPVMGKGAKAAVGPSMESVLNGSYQPLSRPIFIYVNEKSYRKPEVREFVEFYMQHGAKLSREVKYVPLPDRAYNLNREHLKSGKLGSVFGGVPETGITIEALMKREARL
jgi:phosphate transport system substrate-binding protein